jgi:ribonuclease D
VWADRDPVAFVRLTLARAELKELAERLDLPLENLITPDYVRRLLWEPPNDTSAPGDTAGTGDLAALVGARLAELGARPWQIELTREVLARAIRTARE